MATIEREANAPVSVPFDISGGGYVTRRATQDPSEADALCTMQDSTRAAFAEANITRSVINGVLVISAEHSHDWICPATIREEPALAADVREFFDFAPEKEPAGRLRFGLKRAQHPDPDWEL